MVRAILKKIMDILLRPFTRCVLALGHYYGFFNLSYPTVFGSRERLHVGNNVSLLNTLFNTVSGQIRIGDNTIFGQNCMVLTGRHYDGSHGAVLTRAAPAEGYDVVIGKDCWIASGAIVYGRATIGDGTIISAGSVVTGEIPSGVLVAGNPARIVRPINGVYLHSTADGPLAQPEGNVVKQG
jgi:acetyltransferase-like isoleucine patch superfamily enzyme